MTGTKSQAISSFITGVALWFKLKIISFQFNMLFLWPVPWVWVLVTILVSVWQAVKGGEVKNIYCSFFVIEVIVQRHKISLLYCEMSMM